MRYYRLYGGANVATPGRFYTVAWCDDVELAICLKNGWFLDKDNLFGPSGTYPRTIPKEIENDFIC
jgi:hypothetical protein